MYLSMIMGVCPSNKRYGKGSYEYRFEGDNVKTELKTLKIE